VVIGSCNGKVYCFNTPRINYEPQVELISPNKGLIFRSIDDPLLVWSGTDPNPGDTLQYDVYLSTELDSVEDLSPDALASSDQVQEEFDTSGIETGIVYYWRILVSDDEFTATSEIWSFSLNAKPEIQMDEPENEKILASTDVMLSWIASDGDSDDLTYHVYLDDQEIPQTLVASNITSTSFEVSDLQDGESYYWYVEVSDGRENTTTPVFSFSINLQAASNTAPTISLVTPEQDMILDTTEVSLFWSGDDEDGDTLRYTVYFDTETDPETEIVSDIEDDTFLVANLVDGSTYYWKVGVDDGIDKEISEIWSFSIDIGHVENEPPVIELEFPVNNTDFSGEYITLRWTASDKDRDDLTYDVFMGIDSTNLSLISQDQKTKTCYCYNLMGNQTYYWYVVVKDGMNEVSSEIRSFTNLEVQKDSGGGDDDEWISGISNDSLLAGGVILAIAIVAVVIVFFSRRNVGYDDEYYEDSDDWDW